MSADASWVPLHIRGNEVAEKLYRETDAYCHNLAAENKRLRAVVERLDAAISWAMGEEGSDFRPRQPGEPPYWWRKRLGELRALAAPAAPKAPEPCACPVCRDKSEAQGSGRGVTGGAG